MKNNAMQAPLKIGVLGAGHLGKIHLKCLRDVPEFEVVGFHDPDQDVQNLITKEYGITHYGSPGDLISEVDVIDVVSPTQTHNALIREGLNGGCHVFAEKPVTETLAQARELKEIATHRNLKIQIGHVERYNPAFQVARKWDLRPVFIEGHRLAQFNPRGTDVSVVHDLMIHDLDIVRELIPGRIVSIQANGVSVVSDQHDICNARITFENGAVANLTASRISLKSMRKLRLFQRDAYISIDFLGKEADVVRMHDTLPQGEEGLILPVSFQGKTKWIQRVTPEVPQVNAIQTELQRFAQAILDDTTPDVTIDDGIASLEAAEKILEAIHASSERIDR
jgi:predicted dehydrogenase